MRQSLGTSSPFGAPRCRVGVLAVGDGEALGQEQRDVDIGRPVRHGDRRDVVERRLVRFGDVLSSSAVEVDDFPGNVLGRDEREEDVVQHEPVEQAVTVPSTGTVEQVEQLADVCVGKQETRLRLGVVAVRSSGGRQPATASPSVNVFAGSGLQGFDGSAQSMMFASVTPLMLRRPIERRPIERRAVFSRKIERRPMLRSPIERRPCAEWHLEDLFLVDVAAGELGFPEFGVADLVGEVPASQVA